MRIAIIKKIVNNHPPKAKKGNTRKIITASRPNAGMLPWLTKKTEIKYADVQDA